MYQSYSARSYALKILGLSDNIDIKDQYSLQITGFIKFLDNYPILFKLLNSPVIYYLHKVKTVDLVCEEVGVHHQLRNYLLFLVKNRSLNLLSSIIEEYNSILLEMKNIKLINIRSVVELDQVSIDIIKNLLENKLNKQLIFNVTIDSSLLGGMVIQYDNFVINYSIISMLDKIAMSFLEVQKNMLFI
ncbi:ATP synthase F1 subunit delta [Rickettsia endosymbiont of Cardiosporidium cionae]|uniref:ATP synthase F1 subunit delta n=1 Tax=Rickettsia endosymbiont of Cardiosporidium cionae TaxID=2777155 RepID=UPI00189349A2|nr:ATP synthase F1 subunit delta [Rickettsia endosymbiont of Cardiosporidium cionae]KAF8818467.1 ATP synthase subunit delta [Rickettsia endosymbiont of Cardiosporidium cionae]